jgi:hypothetical protein
MHEPDARKAFCEEMQILAPGLAVIETGMWVNPNFCQISCSPDGHGRPLPNFSWGDGYTFSLLLSPL